MPGPAPLALKLNDRYQKLLQHLRRCPTMAHYLVQRAEIILEIAKGYNNSQTAQRLGQNRKTIVRWRTRWLQTLPQLEQLEAKGVADQILLALIKQSLEDADRPGAPPQFTPEQLTQLMALSCRDPHQFGRPITHWTARELAEEAVKQKIVEHISPRTVGRLLVRGGSNQASPKPLLAQS